mmetsp:Transcript_12018/g.21686  ORF Transcript_12018/g.21686 Transcript_12018/m.21686 type:complete len:401 (-) Transcript_12018:83-1285(-)
MMRTVLITLACMAYAGAGFRVQTEAAFQPTGVAPGRSHRATSPSMSYSGGGAWGQWLGNKGFPKAPSPAEVEAQIAARSATATAAAPSAGQDFLEFEPYTDRSTMPDNTFKPKSPFEGKIISVERIVGAKATGETCNVVIDHFGKMPYIEGQSYGVLPPGVSPKTGKPNKVRLYSIASSRYGDDQTGTTTTLCVKRAEYWEEVDGKWQTDPAKKGVCSNYLCDLNCGDLIKITGPVGKVMLLPEEKPDTDIIMAATGTGIAPFRSFLKRMFVDKNPYATDFKGLAWLFLGVYNTDAILYDDEWKAILKEYPSQFRYDLALSEEQKNKDGGPMFVQHRMEEYADDIFDRMNKGAHMYLCGLKGMVPGIQELLQKVAESKNIDYDEWMKNLKKNGQWHVEVY